MRKQRLFISRLPHYESFEHNNLEFDRYIKSAIYIDTPRAQPLHKLIIMAPSSRPPPAPANVSRIVRRTVLLSAAASASASARNHDVVSAFAPFPFPPSSSSSSYAAYRRRPHHPPRAAVVGFRFREVVDENNDVETTAPRAGTTTTTTTNNDKKEKKKPKKKTLSLTVNVNPRVLSKTRKFDSNDIRIIRAERATAAAATPREGSGNDDDDDDDDGGKSKPATAAAVVDKDQNDDDDYDTSKSASRLLKARRLLEMAQISPSQRLERMQRAIVSTTVVPMGSYSMRFGGYGSLEEELESNGGNNGGRVEMRMADTFDRCVRSIARVGRKGEGTGVGGARGEGPAAQSIFAPDDRIVSILFFPLKIHLSRFFAPLFPIISFVRATIFFVGGGVYIQRR